MPVYNIVNADQQKVPETSIVQQIGLMRNKTYSKGDGFSSWIQASRNSDGYTVSSLFCRRLLESDANEIVAEINVCVDPNGNTFANCPNPPVDHNVSSIATTWLARNQTSMVPTSNYINLTLGASDSRYTAPANGYFLLQKTSTKAGQEIRLTNLTARQLVGYATNGKDIGRALGCIVPCKKGDIVNVFYSADGDSEKFYFIYAG